MYGIKQNDISLVSYSNLPAGDYTFCIKAANNDGKWNEEPAILHIHILPVWYCYLVGAFLVCFVVCFCWCSVSYASSGYARVCRLKYEWNGLIKKSGRR